MIHNNEKLRSCPMLENPKLPPPMALANWVPITTNSGKLRPPIFQSWVASPVGAFLPLRLTTSDRIKLAARIAKVAKTVVSAFGVMISSLSFFCWILSTYHASCTIYIFITAYQVGFVKGKFSFAVYSVN